jgi:hypothetical protein
MPRIRLIVEDDAGEPLSHSAEFVYVLDGHCDTLDNIDDAVEKFKNEALPQVEHLLLDEAQAQFTANPSKKGDVS